LTINDMDGLNLKRGPALMAIKGWPFNSKETMSQSPVGVGTSWIVVMFVILEFEKMEV